MQLLTRYIWLARIFCQHTHTHTHTQALQANFIYLFSRIRAREACRNHRLQRDSQVIPLQSDLCFSGNTIHINYYSLKIDSI